MLFEVVTIDLHYMTDRQERFDQKICENKDTYILDALEVLKVNFKVNYPFKCHEANYFFIFHISPTL